MRIHLKPLPEQVVVVMGASSGIGRESALRLAERGATVVVAARNEQGLVSLVDDVRAAGGHASHVVCDVSDFAQVQHVAEYAVQTYGRIDSWINCAALSVFAHFEETTPAEHRRLMEVNYLGQVHGALAALPHLRAGGGGAIIAVSSVESTVSLPRHAAYSASKHAVEGAMDALRRDLMAEKAPISVTSIKPATINTPLFTNSRSRMDVQPKGPPPIYQPKIVAQCVTYAAEHPVRDLFAGGAGKAMFLQQFAAPGLMDAYLSTIGTRQERTRTPTPHGKAGNLDETSSDDRTQGDYSGRSRGFSLYTYLETHPVARRLTTGTVLAAAPVLIKRLARTTPRTPGQ